MTSEHTETTQGRLRTMNLSVVSGAVSAVGALLVAIDARSWPDALLLGASLGAALVTVNQWPKERFLRVALPSLVVTATVWLLGVLVVDSASASYGFAIVATVIVLGSPRHRRVVIAGTVAFALAVVAARLLLSPDDVLGVLLRYVLVSAATAMGGVVLMILAHTVQGLTRELEEARGREAELAVAQERMRFASDLHDIQGHTLHVVKLKTALARKLVRADAERAEEELGEIHTLVGDTIAQTKELAHAQRRLNLSAELENAKNLFEAAGIRVRVDRGAEVDARVSELLGQVLRETTTNILRHAQAGRVHITLAATGITIVNDGARRDRPPELRGLSALRERVAGGGGTLTVEQEEGRFLTAAAFPNLPPAPHTTTRKDDR